MIAVQICIAYGSMALFIALLNNVFLLYYVDLFVSVYRIDKMSFWIGEVIFLIWNSVNDPLFGWLSDHKSLNPNNCGVTSPQIAQKRFGVLSKFGPLFALSFLLFWFPWGPPGLQFVLCLCFYDGFLTLVDLNHLALLADLALSAKDRTRLNGYCSVFSVFGCLSVFLSYSVWDKDNIASFRLFCFCLSMFALVGFTVSSIFLRNHLKCEKVKVDTPIEDTRKSMAVSVTKPSDIISQEIELKEYIKQLVNHKNFLWFAVMNLVQVFHCHFNSNFFPLFLEKLLGDTISPKVGAMLLCISFVVPHINNLYFLSLCRKYGVYRVIKWLFYAKLCLGISMMSCGPQWTVLVCIFIASNRVFTEGTCKLLNLVISDLVDEDFVLHGRKQAISALVFGTSALLSKPGQTLAPLIGTWLLASQTGFSIFYTDSNEKQTSNFHDNTGKDLRWGCFCVLVYIPIACALIQILAWSRFTLHGNRLTWVKHMRKNQGFQSATVY